MTKLYLAHIEMSGYNINIGIIKGILNGCGETPLDSVKQLEIKWNEYRTDDMFSFKELVENNGLTITELKPNTNWLEGNTPIYYSGYDLAEMKGENS